MGGLLAGARSSDTLTHACDAGVAGHAAHAVDEWACRHFHGKFPGKRCSRPPEPKVRYSWPISAITDPAAHAALIAFCPTNRIDLVVVGPEGLLCAGTVDHLEAAGIKTFGPRSSKARDFPIGAGSMPRRR
jgi:hypothetical protein